MLIQTTKIYLRASIKSTFRMKLDEKSNCEKVAYPGHSGKRGCEYEPRWVMRILDLIHRGIFVIFQIAPVFG